MKIHIDPLDILSSTKTNFCVQSVHGVFATQTLFPFTNRLTGFYDRLMDSGSIAAAVDSSVS